MMPITIRSNADYQSAVAELTALQRSGEDPGRAETLTRAIEHYETIRRAFWDSENATPPKSNTRDTGPEWQ